jgi:hypothetical protein
MSWWCNSASAIWCSINFNLDGRTDRHLQIFIIYLTPMVRTYRFHPYVRASTLKEISSLYTVDLARGGLRRARPPPALPAHQNSNCTSTSSTDHHRPTTTTTTYVHLQYTYTNLHQPTLSSIYDTNNPPLSLSFRSPSPSTDCVPGFYLIYV